MRTRCSLLAKVLEKVCELSREGSSAPAVRTSIARVTPYPSGSRRGLVERRYKRLPTWGTLITNRSRFHYTRNVDRRSVSDKSSDGRLASFRKHRNLRSRVGARLPFGIMLSTTRFERGDKVFALEVDTARTRYAFRSRDTEHGTYVLISRLPNFEARRLW